MRDITRMDCEVQHLSDVLNAIYHSISQCLEPLESHSSVHSNAILSIFSFLYSPSHGTLHIPCPSLLFFGYQSGPVETRPRRGNILRPIVHFIDLVPRYIFSDAKSNETSAKFSVILQIIVYLCSCEGAMYEYSR